MFHYYQKLKAVSQSCGHWLSWSPDKKEPTVVLRLNLHFYIIINKCHSIQLQLYDQLLERQSTIKVLGY